ncbi:MAG TPA: response regulator [Polyangiales bacterium]
MSSNRESALCAEVATAVAGAEARCCLEAALAALREHGIMAQAESDARPSWLRVERDGQVVRLWAEAPPPDEPTRMLLAALLGTALAREAEARDHARTRERMDMLSAASFEGILIHVDRRAFYVNDRMVDLFGFSREEMLQEQAFGRSVAPESQAMATDRVERRIEGTYMFHARRKDGSQFLAEVQSKQGKLGERPVRVVAIRDVTERERINALLREGERRLHQLVQATFDFVVLSRDGIVVEASGATEAVLGMSSQEMVGREGVSFLASEQQEQWRAIIAENRMGAFEAEVIAADGERVPVKVVSVSSTLNGEPVRLNGVHDLREVRRLEQERQKLQLLVERGQRLQSLGVLAGGIAHDFNNLLVGVMGNAELLASRLTDPKDLGACELILAAGERGANLTRQLLAYAGKSEPLAREPVDLAALWRELRGVLDATLSKHARITLHAEPRCIVLGERATLMQVLMNLLTNASDALADRAGFIEVSMHRVREPGPEWKESLGTKPGPGDWVLVQIRDSGAGMDETTCSRIFEPFFSTKAKGHGLGLATCLGIVAAHGGAIRVESTPGLGSCFSLLLPALDSLPQRVEPVPATAQPGACRVLVVDDDPFVRTNIRDTLELRGFTVFEAVDGESGLAAIDASKPDLLIVDFTMPDIEGTEVVRRLRATGSNIPILLSSGHVESDVLRGLSPSSIQGILHKPFGPKLLLAAIERALTAGRTALPLESANDLS